MDGAYKESSTGIYGSDYVAELAAQGLPEEEVLARLTARAIEPWNPHMRAIVTRGVLMGNGSWHPIPYVDPHKAKLLFRHTVFRLLRDRDVITQDSISR